MTQNTVSTLSWPLEVAVPDNKTDAELSVPGSNIVLDLHGDPGRAKLVVFSDGNHHMALQETLAAFVRNNPDVEDVFYATTPPRVISDALKSGQICSGNLLLTVNPHIFISPGDVLDTLLEQGLVGPHEPIMQSDGLAILLQKGNPKNIKRPEQLLEPSIRMAISNPVTEKASFSVYCAAFAACAKSIGKSESETITFLNSSDVVKSQIIHHREIPQMLATGQADASLVYYHLALRYTRIFPEHFDLIKINTNLLPDPGRFVTAYHLALVENGGAFGIQFAEFFKSPEANAIYSQHGLKSYRETS